MTVMEGIDAVEQPHHHERFEVVHRLLDVVIGLLGGMSSTGHAGSNPGMLGGEPAELARMPRYRP